MAVNNLIASQSCVDRIKATEELRLVGYLCPAGVPTDGWGHTGPEVRVGRQITLATAQANFDGDLYRKAEQPILNSVKVPLNQNQFDALVSLVFNIGAGNFASSTLLQKLNNRDYAGAAGQFLVWNKVRDPHTKQLVVSNGLSARRAAEKATFETAVA
ncbi:lysozyme [Caballeronia fortuita]|uniref:Lysozyme n=1 Tax=Caballeronia fortuita TaxID=1777138 RepID=A0A158E8G2_9BURK|nr:lysozyme [Caballeronia fortuita]SAL03172.1 lysozyme [Caballeronia fortuita]